MVHGGSSLHLNVLRTHAHLLLHPLSRPQAKAKIMVVRDIERDDIEFISKTLGCLPVAHPDHLKPEKLGSAELVEEVEVMGDKGGIEAGDWLGGSWAPGWGDVRVMSVVGTAVDEGGAGDADSAQRTSSLVGFSPLIRLHDLRPV